MNGMSSKWNPKTSEIRAVEKSLQPLVLQVTTLVNTENPSKKKKGRSKRAQVIVAAIEQAFENFIEIGKQIADENLAVKREMLNTMEEVRETGNAMCCSAREFAETPFSSLQRGDMVRAARNLLSAVTKLMIMADMIDVLKMTGAVNDITSIIDASKLVYEGVSEIRRAVLIKRTDRENEISEENKRKVEDFHNEKMKFDKEIAM